MAEHFNQLTPAEHERLSILVEECGEVIQVAGKILRHGFDSFNPLESNAPTNRQLLEKELGDVEAIKRRMFEAEDISKETIASLAAKKYKSMAKWLHHQGIENA